MERAISQRPDPSGNSRPERAARAPVPANNRSRLTNGSTLGIDLRTASGRRWRDLFVDAMAASGQRNEVLCRSLASMVVQRERMDAAIARGEDVDVGELIRVVGVISRLATKLGIVADEPSEDATADAILAARKHMEAARR